MEWVRSLKHQSTGSFTSGEITPNPVRYRTDWAQGYYGRFVEDTNHFHLQGFELRTSIPYPSHYSDCATSARFVL